MLWPAGCGGVCNVMSRIVASLVCNLTMRQILRHIELNIPSIITFHSTHSLLAESTTAAHSSAPARNYLIWWVASLLLWKQEFYENQTMNILERRGSQDHVYRVTVKAHMAQIQTSRLNLGYENSILVSSYFQYILIITESLPLPRAKYLSF